VGAARDTGRSPISESSSSEAELGVCSNGCSSTLTSFSASIDDEGGKGEIMIVARSAVCAMQRSSSVIAASSSNTSKPESAGMDAMSRISLPLATASASGHGDSTRSGKLLSTVNSTGSSAFCRGDKGSACTGSGARCIVGESSGPPSSLSLES
jgi:hypothetical protein